MKVYISGKISGLDPQDAKSKFQAWEDILKAQGHCVVNPFKITPLLGIKQWLCYMIADIYQQSKCTHTAIQDNWKESRGAVIEYFFAKFIFRHKITWLLPVELVEKSS